MRWPKNLIEELAHRRSILFLGSGVSATSVSSDGKPLKTWTEVLEAAKSLMKNYNNEKEFVDKMLKENNNLMALEAIFSDCDTGEYGYFLKEEFGKDSFTPSNIHEAIKEIDCKIIITTNFDKILDKICNDEGYVVCEYYDVEKIISHIKSPKRIIIKAHGCIDNLDKIIFTGSQYFKAKKENPGFYKILESLFITHTVIFLGYSLSDPDINLNLENILNTASPHHPHYVLVKKGNEDIVKKHWKETYNISALEFGADYKDFIPAIEELRDQVNQFREERLIP